MVKAQNKKPYSFATISRAFSIFYGERSSKEARTECFRRVDAERLWRSRLDYAQKQAEREAFEYGQRKVELEIAGKLLAMNYDIAKIAKFTGLPIDAIKKLKKE